MFKEPNGPLYIMDRVSHSPSCGTLVDPCSIVNVITEEHLFEKGLHRDNYDMTLVWIQTLMVFFIILKVISLYLLLYHIGKLFLLSLLLFLLPINFMLSLVFHGFLPCKM